MRKFSRDLLEYYDKYRRILPWREEPSPYGTWVSEIMLQQTRVDTVITYYKEFIKELPTIKDLAACPEDKLLKLWQGLGYYSRVRNMKKAAIQIMEDFQGQLPETKKELESLSGIGPYTAGAISSMAFNQKETCIDGNFLRVMSRILAQPGDPRKKENFKRIEEETFHRMSDTRPGDFNQAMMDVGATICLPNGQPKCESCPLKTHCKAFEEGDVLKYPEKKKKLKRRREDYHVLLLKQGNRILLEKRSKKGVLKGLWGFPMVDLGDESFKDKLKDLYGPLEIKVHKKSKHIFSHIEWHMESYVVEIPQDQVAEDLTPYIEERVWATRKDIEEIYSIPTAFKPFLKDFMEEESHEL